jgi:tRNA modification GTPase
VLNKIDLNEKVSSEINDAIYISAINQTGIDILKSRLCKFTNVNSLDNNNTVVTNQRHYEQLLKTITELELVIKGLEDGLSSDLLAINIKESLYHLGLITGEVSSDDLLGNIFGKFCIGK